MKFHPLSITSLSSSSGFFATVVRMAQPMMANGSDGGSSASIGSQPHEELPPLDPIDIPENGRDADSVISGADDENQEGFPDGR